MKMNILSAAAIGAAVLAAPASAATIVTISGGDTYCESGNFSAQDLTCTTVSNLDLSNALQTPDVITFAGAGTLGGFVADAKGGATEKYPDYAKVVLDFDAFITMTLVNPTALFDANFTFGSLVDVDLDMNSGTVSFAAAAGEYAFGINATSPTNQDVRQESSYALEVSPVPLPAGMVLLLTGLGGLAAVRRKRAA